ncbi:MAG: endonuclease NucS [Cellulomonadaceae bacterium]|jgi:RecB family endonuclease NucS|nr:endonuclease NucS [Cellulomonadaceae bacterium]
MRVVVAECSAVYSGRLGATLPRATRVIMVKADGSVLLHSDGGSYKPLNWMSPPCVLSVSIPSCDEGAASADLEDSDSSRYSADPESPCHYADPEGVSQNLEAPSQETPRETWTVTHAKTEDTLRISIYDILHEWSGDLGQDPGLIKDGVEAQLQKLLAEQIPAQLGEGHTLVRREYPTAIGPVDILARAPEGGHVAVEIKRRGEIDGVEQLTRYLELLNRDPLLQPVRGVFAAQEIKPQARVLAADRGIDCLTLDYLAMKGQDSAENRLF